MSWNLELEPKKHILTTVMYNKHYLYLKYEVTAHSFHYKSFLEGYFIFLPFPGLPSIPPLSNNQTLPGISQISTSNRFQSLGDDLN